ncbi:hypothetical protein GCM10009682_54630 [Luedemannella flava]|uniref:Uncharacterized protein n=1 Tax=Luedemannella flava TaxID=349316 RepID=A0ABN2MJG2_9ACTN
MTALLRTAGDRLLGKIAPKRTASACYLKYTYCAYQFTGCGGGQCYYYYQRWNTCYVGKVPLTDCLNAWRTYSGCC